jgi:5-methylcytosine-specific restriction endonuclease McrA
MADQDAHFRIMDEALKHPDGRAKGGEPCVICGKPVPASAHWVQRDRHACSGRCNNLLRRRYGRGSASINTERVSAAVEAVGPRPSPRTSDSRVFRTRPGVHLPQLPIEWEGYGPHPGDVVERYGILTRFVVQDMPEGYFTPRVVIAVAEGGDMFVAGANGDGYYSLLVIGPHAPGGQRLEGQLFSYTFQVNGVLCEWRRERITDLQPDGVYYFFWECYAAVPVDAPKYPEPMHSARYRAEMDRRRRVSSNAAKHERRAREEAKIERFDPLEVYKRDGWLCGICRAEVDPAVLHPDPMSASLDHVVPLSKGGDHTRENSVLAHLICNIRKSAS